MFKLFAQLATTATFKTKLHEILQKFPSHDLSNHLHREQIINEILQTLGGAIEKTVDYVRGETDEEEGEEDTAGNPFFE